MNKFWLGEPPEYIANSKRFPKLHINNNLDIPSLSQLDDARLPNPADFQHSAEVFTESSSNIGEIALADGAGQLGELLELSLSRCKDILELQLHTGDDNFGAILRAHVSAIQTVFNAQLRADEGRLRQRQTDMMPRILALLEGEEKKLLLLERSGQQLQ